MTTSLDRLMTLQTVGVEVFVSRDGQGQPTYATSVDIQAHVVQEDKLVHLADGTEVRSSYTVYVPGATKTRPAHRDRITIATVPCIVLERKLVTDLHDTLDHVRLHAREE